MHWVPRNAYKLHMSQYTYRHIVSHRSPRNSHLAFYNQINVQLAFTLNRMCICILIIIIYNCLLSYRHYISTKMRHELTWVYRVINIQISIIHSFITYTRQTAVDSYEDLQKWLQPNALDRCSAIIPCGESSNSVLAIHGRRPGRILSPGCNRFTCTAWRLLKTFLFVATAQCELL